MDDYAIEVHLIAVVRVNAADEAAARKVVPTVLGAPGSVEISVANDNNAGLGINATVTHVDFFPKLSSVAVTEVNGKTMKARKSRRERRASGVNIENSPLFLDFNELDGILFNGEVGRH